MQFWNFLCLIVLKAVQQSTGKRYYQAVANNTFTHHYDAIILVLAHRIRISACFTWTDNSYLTQDRIKITRNKMHWLYTKSRIYVVK